MLTLGLASILLKRNVWDDFTEYPNFATTYFIFNF